MDVLRTSSAESIQSNEATALEAIFGESFEILESTNQKLVAFRLTLVPHPGVPEENHCGVKMKVVLPESYPAALPRVTFEPIKGLTDAELDELRNAIKTKLEQELSGQNREIVFDLTQAVEEFLQAHNLPPQSLHDQMVARQKAQEKEARERERQKLRLEREEADSFESHYEANRMRSLLGSTGNGDENEDVYSAMGKDVSRAMSYKPSRPHRVRGGADVSQAPYGNDYTTTMNRTKKEVTTTRTKSVRPAISHFDDQAGSQGSDTDSFDMGYSDEDLPEDESFYHEDNQAMTPDFDSDSPFSHLESKLTAGRRVDLRKASKGTGKTSTVENPNAAHKTQPSDKKIDKKRDQSRRSNTFFASPVGFEWDHHEDDDSDEYEDADKTRVPSDANQANDEHLPRPPVVQKSLVKWANPREIWTSKTCKIYKAMDVTSGSAIAVKEYALPPLDDSKTEMLETLCENIFRASRSLSHEHLIKYLGADYKPQSNVLCVLRDSAAAEVSALLKNKPFEEPKVRNYILHLVSCIAYLHGKGLYGLNIKLNNLLLDNQGKLKLADYLGANQICALKDPNFKPVSGDNWWSPEVRQVARSERDQDLVDLGNVMLELSTGTKTRTTLPNNFTAHASNFLQNCLSPNGQTITDLKSHPFIAFDEEEYTQGEFVPLSPASSAPGFHLWNRGAGDVSMDPSSSHWTSSTNTGSQATSSLHNSQSTAQSTTDKVQSRYRVDFEELQILGKGGFGQVVKARNRLDANLYAIKKIRFGRTDAGFVEKLKREVMTLSRLNHPHVVRYFQAWIGEADEEDFEEEEEDEEDEEYDEYSDEADDDHSGSSGCRHGAASDEDDLDQSPSLIMEDEQDLFESLKDVDDTFDEDRVLSSLPGMLGMSRTGRMKAISSRGGHAVKRKPRPAEKKQEKSATRHQKPPSKILYIQMEYCTEKTLKNMIDENKLSDEMKWKLFRQIVEGLHHIHSQGIIHRDLKPTNVFIDASGDTKIGDFGLAVTSGGPGAQGRESGALALSRQAAASGSGTRDPAGDGLTTGVGTPLYLAPEQDRPGAYYNQKVDIYSLGIIFFELFTPFSTAMERYTVIKDLRTKEIKVPPTWDRDPIKYKLVKWMLSHDPENRPTTLALLQSEYLPVKLEDETLKEAMRSITQPNTTMHSLLLKRLFSVPSDPSTDLSYDLNATFRTPQDAVLYQYASRRLTRIFEQHGAEYVEPPAFFPRPSMFLNPHTVQFLAPSGTVIAVPYDLTIPFARYVAQRNVRHLRRYVFGTVYRATTGQPKEMSECDFDLVGPSTNRLVMSCEVVQVLVEILNEFREELGRSIIRFNNFKVLDAIIGRISDSFDVQRKIRGALAGFWRKHSIRETEKVLLSIEGVTAKALEAVKMDQLLLLSKDFNCRASDMLTKIEALFPKDKIIQETIRETNQFIYYADLFRISSHLRFDLTLVYNYEYYYDIVFQGFLLSGEPIAVGGCYDGVVEHFAAQSLDSGVVWSSTLAGGAGATPFARTSREKRKTHRSAVGMNLALDNLISKMGSPQQRDRAKQQQQSMREEDKEKRSFAGSAPIVVYSQLRQPVSNTSSSLALEDRIQVVEQLWRQGLAAEYLYDENLTLEALTRECETHGVQFIVIMKESKKESGGTVERRTPVRVKDVKSKSESSITFSELSAFLRAHLTTMSPLHDSFDASEGYRGIGGSAVALSSASSAASLVKAKTTASTPSVGAGSGSSGGGGPGIGSGGGRNSIDSPPVSHHVAIGRTAEADCLDIEIIGPLRQEKGAKGKRDIVRTAGEKILPHLKNFAPRPSIKVGAVDIPLPQLREILLQLEAGGEIAPLERKLPKVKDRIPYIKEYWVKVRRDKHPFAFFYSIIDDDFHMSFLKR